MRRRSPRHFFLPPLLVLFLLGFAAAFFFRAAASAATAAAAPEEPPATMASSGLSIGRAKLLGGGSKPLLGGRLSPAEKKPTPASLALQRLQNLAVNALRDRGYTDVAEVTVGDEQRLGRFGRLAPLASSSTAGQEAAGSSIVTLDLPNAPLAELANVVDLYQSIFGITPDFSTVNDTASFYQRVQEIMISSAPAISFDCQPSFRVWPKEINFAFPDQHSALHFFVLPSFGPNDLVMLEGTFPDARYFSFQTYDAALRPVSYLRDAQIKPLGDVSNPFASAPTANENEEGAPISGAGQGQQHREQHKKEKAQYRLYLTKDGKRGFPNELAATGRAFALRGMTVVVLRLYGVDPRADLADKELEPWGYVPPVRVSARVLGTIASTATNLIWETFPECPLNNTLVVRDALTAITNLVSVADTAERTCQSENVPDNFVLFRPDESKQLTGRTPFANSRDASFLLACANHRNSYRKGSDLVAVVRARLPLTPVGLAAPPFVGDPASYDVRYASLSVADLNPPGPVLRTVADDEFRAFYHRLYGAMEWEAMYGRNVSLVVARNRAVLERCGVDTAESFVVELDHQTPASDWFGIIYREVLAQGATAVTPSSQQKDGGIAAAAQVAPASGASGRVPFTQSIYDAQRAVCLDREGATECDPNPYRVASVMKGHFPRVHYFLCSQLGTLTPAPPGRDPFAGKGYPPLQDEADGSGPWPDVPTYLEFCNETGPNEGLLRVFAPSNWVHVHFRDGQRPGGSGSAAVSSSAVKAVVPPGTVGVWAFPVPASAETVVVGLSIKAVNATEAPFTAEVELCGSVFPADAKWRCYNEPPVDPEAWLLPGFDDARWRPAAWAPPACSSSSSTTTTAGSSSTATALAAASDNTRSALRHFSPGARFVLPGPALDAEAEGAWDAWTRTKEEANEAFRSWRAAVEKKSTTTTTTNQTAGAGVGAGIEATTSDEAMRFASSNATAPLLQEEAQLQQQYATSMRGGAAQAGAGAGKNSAAADDNANTGTGNATTTTESPHWKDHAPPNDTERLQRLEWHKPRPASIHGYYCRLELPNPAAVQQKGRAAGRPKAAAAAAAAAAAGTVAGAAPAAVLGVV